MEMLLILKSFINERISQPAMAHEVYMDYFLCGKMSTPEPDMAHMFQQYCQVAKARWILAFVLAVLVFGELASSYWARDFEVQQEQDRELQTGTGYYKTMPADAEA